MKRILNTLLTALLIGSFLVALPLTMVIALDTGVTYPGNAANNDRDGKEAWTATSSCLSDNGNYAYCVIPSSTYSDWLYPYSFGFAIPSFATIIGVKVEVGQKADTLNTISDSAVYLYNGTANIGDNKANASYWPKSEATQTYGNATDLWGAVLTPAIVNDSGFGVRISAQNGNLTSPKLAQVDFVRITIYYTTPTIPEVETLPASSITYNSARINGNITDDGDDTCEARFRWLKSADEPDPPWLNNFTNRIKLTTDQTDIDGDLTNFPILLYLSTSSGRNAEDLSFIFDELTADDSRKKIAVTKSDGLTQCYVEIEKWDDANEKAWLWTNGPSVNGTSDTDFWFYYDADATNNTAYVGDINDAAAANVWDSNFKAVYHMRDGASTSAVYDSTGNNYDGTKAGAGEPAVTTDANGKIDGAQDFDGANDTISTSDFYGASISVECWMNMDVVADYKSFIAKDDVATNREYDLTLDTSKPVFFVWNATEIGYRRGTTTITSGTYRHIVGTYDGSTIKVYLNGAEETYDVSDTVSGSLKDGTQVVTLGSKVGASPNYLNGKVDEVRISNTTRSAAWIKATYETSRDNLLDWGTEENDPWTYTSWQNSLETGDTFYEDITGLDPVTEYAYQAQARNDAGESNWTASAYFTTCPAAPTNVSASDGTYTDKVVINWTKSTGATGYKVYRGAVLVDTLGDVATYNDTGADAGIITPGTASATDGVHTDKVVLSLSGESVSNGTAHNYTVKAFNGSGDSPASSPDSGYRTMGSLTYQWMVSAADSDAAYSNIGGGTTDPYDYTGAPAGTLTPGTGDASDGNSTLHTILTLSGQSVSDGAGRYYKCTLSATGAADQNSTSDRGYRTTGALTYQWLISAADSDDTYSNLAGATSASHNDTTAPAPTINGGNATASDGTSSTIVTLDLANHNATEGDGRHYLCSLSATGTADQNSTSNRGYRGTTSLVLQWFMSLADSDADYSEIGGGTTNPYNDTGGVAAPDGRYYQCMVNMTGATSQNSTSDRGYMITIVAPTVTAQAADNITGSSADLHGNITDTGYGNPATRGFEWGTSTGNYTSNWTEAGNFTAGTFSHTIFNLTAGLQYFWRAFAINSGGRGDSAELNFTTLLLPGPPLNFTITQTGSDSISINWTLGINADGTEIRVSTTGYPGDVTGGFLVYNGTGTGVSINGLNLDMNTYYYRAWSWNTYGYSIDYAEGHIGGASMEMLVFGILPLGLLGLFLWKRLALLAYGSAVTWGLFGFFAFQTSTSPSPAQIQDIYMALFWVCIAFVITMMFLPLVMREKKEPEELYVDELDTDLEKTGQKKREQSKKQGSSKFAANGKM